MLLPVKKERKVKKYVVQKRKMGKGPPKLPDNFPKEYVWEKAPAQGPQLTLTQSTKPKKKTVQMYAGMPMYRERGDVNQIKTLDLINPQNDILNAHIMDAVGFVPKKDFDTEPASLEELSPALENLPYEPPKPGLPMNPGHNKISLRDFVMPKGGGMMPKDHRNIKKHVAGWNEETIKPKAWKPLDPYYFRNDGRYHEHRPVDQYIRPKDWRIMHPEQKYPAKKGIFVLKALEDIRSRDGAKKTKQLMLTGGKGAAGGVPTNPAATGRFTGKGTETKRAGKEPVPVPPTDGAPLLKTVLPEAPAEEVPDAVGGAFMTQGDDEGAAAVADPAAAEVKEEAIANATSPDPAAAAAAEVAEEIVKPPPPPPQTTQCRVCFIAGKVGCVHGLDGQGGGVGDELSATGKARPDPGKIGDVNSKEEPFLHGTWGKWDKFAAGVGGRTRKSMQTVHAKVLKRKPKFNALRYIQQKQEGQVKVSTERAALLTETGYAEIERPHKDRVLHADPNRHRAKKKKIKARWETHAVISMLRGILSTEDSKLKSLELQLHRASEDLARSGAAVYTLDGYRQSIQKIRRRIADLREGTAFVRKPDWLKDITRLLISSAVPLDKFLADAEKLVGDGGHLINDTPWDDDD